MLGVMSDRVIFIDKPAGMTSFGVVARVRRALSQRAGKKVKVGHCGTLDPFATGLLILVTGKECCNAMYYTKLDKVYEATIRLGQISTTGDPEGEITNYNPHLATQTSSDKQFHATPLSFNQQENIGLRGISEVSALPHPDILTIQATFERFTGEIKQRPPVFSAIKINGKRAYKLARDGKEIDMPERMVTIYSLKLLEYNYPLLKMCAHVSSGTYIRSLVVDIGETLGTGAYCQELRRTQIADWQVDQAQKLVDFGIQS